MSTKNVNAILKALSAEEKAELTKSLVEQSQAKSASTKKVEYEYGKVAIVVEVRAKGSKGEYQTREVVCNPLAKSSLNNHIFAPSTESGVMISRKGIYLTKSNTKVESAKS